MLRNVQKKTKYSEKARGRFLQDTVVIAHEFSDLGVYFEKLNRTRQVSSMIHLSRHTCENSDPYRP